MPLQHEELRIGCKWNEFDGPRGSEIYEKGDNFYRSCFVPADRRLRLPRKASYTSAAELSTAQAGNGAKGHVKGFHDLR
jgi:hypothetical protein